MKVVTIVGARPQFIKAAVVSKAFAHHHIEEVIVHTGQHFDANMSQVFFEEMQIPIPDYNLQVHSLGHGAMTGRMLEEIEKVLIKEAPDKVVVYGDTNSTLAGALAAKKLHIAVVHIEAGLRSYNQRMPEEINRILTDRISDILFCPSEDAVRNLQKEALDQLGAKIICCGDVMYDAAMHFREIASKKHSILEDLALVGKDFVLATIHRQENTDERNSLLRIVEALNRLHQEVEIVLPLHPRTRKKLDEFSITPLFTVTEPFGYLQMIQLLQSTRMVITDSGGLQKEAYFFHKPCVTVREETEWTELVEHGYNTLLPPAQINILPQLYYRLLKNLPDFSKQLYGTGSASEIIAKEILKA